MRAVTVKWIILGFTLIAIALVAGQLYWLDKVYTLHQREFTSAVLKSAQGVYADLKLDTAKALPISKMVVQPGERSFIFKINEAPSLEALTEATTKHMDDFGLFADCKIGLYNARTGAYQTSAYLHHTGTTLADTSKINMPPPVKTYSNFLLFFPNRNQYVITSMRIWMLSSSVLLLVLLGLCISNFMLYRQKFLNEIQSDFMRNVTHEFQTPLTTLTVGLQMLGRPGIIGNEEKRNTYLQLMQGQTQYLKQHIENLMKAIKAESRGLAPKQTACCPNELIRNAVAQLFISIEEKHGKINLDLEPNDTIIKADNNSLYVSILNLISNGLKYAEHPILHITTTIKSGMFSIAVKDNGIGIPPLNQKKLFKKFYRVPTGDVQNVRGLGLGLYFVKKVVTEHNGAIAVESQPGHGSTFTIHIPIQH